VLLEWEREKQNKFYEYLYICARIKGRVIASLWISDKQNTYNVIEESMAEAVLMATSFDVEFLYQPQTRILDINKKNQWNCHRGKCAVLLNCYNKSVKWSSLEMISHNISFNWVGKNYLKQCNLKVEIGGVIPVIMYQTKQFLCGNESNKTDLPTSLYRGDRLVRVNEINRDTFFTV